MPSLPTLHTRAALRPETLNTEQRTVDVVWTTGAQVRRFDLFEGPYVEELSLDPAHVRLDRLNNGAPLLANHDARSLDSVVGVVERAWLDGNEGRATIRFSSRTDVDSVLADVRDGVLRNISVGYAVHKYDEVEGSGKRNMPVFRATDWEPMELSIVPIPADASAQIRSGEPLHPLVINRSAPTMSEPKAVPETPAVEEPVIEQRASVDLDTVKRQAIEAERARIAAIRDAVRMAKLGDEVAEKLIADGVPVDAAKAEVIRQWESRVNATATQSERIEAGPTAGEKAIRGGTEAMLVRAGLSKDDIPGNEFRGWRLSDFARWSLESQGQSTRGMSYTQIAKAINTRAQGTSDFAVILENTMHKSVLAAYQTAPDTWRQICSTGSVSDFRAWKRLRTGTLSNLDPVNEFGELTNMQISDADAESVQVSRYGNIIALTPEVIVNDDLGWIANQTAAMGRAAARTIEAAVYAKLLANPTMSDGEALLSSAHGNIQTSGAAISVATVDAGRVAMAQQMDKDGNDYLNIRPSILLCPVASGGLARTVAQSQYDPDAAARLLVPNKVAGLISTVIDTPRITTGWYLLADPMGAPVLEVVFLDGKQAPTLEQDTDFRTKGLSWSVEMPFGVGVVDYRGIYWNDGA